jgi:hypothetical protein
VYIPKPDGRLRPLEVAVVSPGNTGISQARAKTDRLDARTLAKLLWAGELDAVRRPDEHTRVLRGGSHAASSWSVPRHRTRS